MWPLEAIAQLSHHLEISTEKNIYIEIKHSTATREIKIVPRCIVCPKIRRREKKKESIPMWEKCIKRHRKIQIFAASFIFASSDLAFGLLFYAHGFWSSWSFCCIRSFSRFLFNVKLPSGSKESNQSTKTQNIAFSETVHRNESKETEREDEKE